MRRHRVLLPVLVAAFSACVVAPESLNSERIESQFGNYGIEVLEYVDGVRRANLHSVTDGRRVCRTYAVVRFDQVPEEMIGAEHAMIESGASVGATFKAAGWQIFKETRYLGDVGLGNDVRSVYRLMHLDGNPPLAMHVYRLLLKKRSEIIEYATIIELHHPDYLSTEQLETLFAVDRMDDITDAELGDWMRLVATGN